MPIQGSLSWRPRRTSSVDHEQGKKRKKQTNLICGETKSANPGTIAQCQSESDAHRARLMLRLKHSKVLGEPEPCATICSTGSPPRLSILRLARMPPTARVLYQPGLRVHTPVYVVASGHSTNPIRSELWGYAFRVRCQLDPERANPFLDIGLGVKAACTILIAVLVTVRHQLNLTDARVHTEISIPSEVALLECDCYRVGE